MITWLIGLSGAGKTTVGRLVHARLQAEHANTVFLDGDMLREVWGSPGHDMPGRRVNAERISRLCHLLDQQGIHVVAAVLSVFPEWQAWNRDNFSAYTEVFLDVPLAELKRRDSKGLYSAAERGEITNVMGVDLPFPRPPNPDLVLAAPEVLEPPERLAERILHLVRQRARAP